MSIYCVSDLHGQYELFLEGLNKINFKKSKDKLYILGDVCNGGLKSLELYTFILNNKRCVKLLLGNHDLYFLSMLKVFKIVLNFPEVLSALKDYLTNYVSGFEKARKFKTQEELKIWETTERRKKCIESFYTYIKMCKIYNIPNYLKLANCYETCFKTKNLMKELISNLNYNFDELIQYLESCPLIKTINVNGNRWVMYHSEHSDNENNNNQKNRQLVSRLARSFKTKKVNYIYGHTPIPQMINQFTNKKLDYNKCLKSQDYFGNKYYNIDLSHYGLCFFNLNLLEETYIGNHSEIETCSKSLRLDDLEIIDLTDIYERNRKYLIKKNEYFYALAIYKHTEKTLKFYSFCELFNNISHILTTCTEHRPSMQDALIIFKNLQSQPF